MPAPVEAPTFPGRFVAGTAILSAAVLSLELVLTRLLSFALSYHFAYATIATALLGMGAGGSLVALRGPLDPARRLERMGRAAWIAAMTTPLALAFTARLPLDPFRLLESPVQIPLLVLHLAASLLPFLTAGAALAHAFAARVVAAPRLYAGDLGGAAVGAFLAMPLLRAFGAPGAAVAAAAGFAVASWAYDPRNLLGSLLAVVLGGALLAGGALEVPPCPTKPLAHVRTDTTTSTIFSQWSPIARIDVVRWASDDRSRETGLWSVWGRGRDNHIPSPPQYTIAQDADAFTLMYHLRDPATDLDFLNDHVLQLPYTQATAPQVLVIGVGGGTDVLAALHFGARHVTAVDVNPVTVSLLKQHFADWLGGVFRDDPRVQVVNNEGRHFLRSTADIYDVIQVNGVDTVAAAASGSWVLVENYLYTVEAIGDLLDRLDPNGVLSIVIMDNLADDTPPRHMLRLTDAMVTALRRRGVADPAAQLAIVGAPEAPGVTAVMQRLQSTHRPIMVMELLLRPRPFAPAETQRLTARADQLGFRIWQAPGRAPDPLVAPLLGDPAERAAFVDDFPLRIDAPTDDRPFFFTFYRWLDLPHHVQLDPNRATATGQLVLLVLLVAELLIGVAVVGWPLWRRGRDGLALSAVGRTLIYFAALGVGFAAVEMALVQQLVLLLGDPTRSLSVTIPALLAASAFGSLLSERVPTPGPAAAARIVVVIGALLLAAATWLPQAVAAILPHGELVRIGAAILFVAPVGVVLGMMLPLGLRALGGDTAVAWAWAVNGVASVVGTLLAVLLAMTGGFAGVLWLATAIYAVAAVAAPSSTANR